MHNKNTLLNADLESTLSASMAGMILFDSNKEIVYVNRSATIIFNKNLHDLLNKKCGDFIGCVNRLDDHRGCGHALECQYCKLYQSIRLKIENENENDIFDETKIDRDVNPNPLWIRFKAAHIPINGQKHVVISVNNVNTTKNLESRLVEQIDYNRRILNSLDAHIAVVDSDGSILKFNSAWKQFAQHNNAGGEKNWGLGACYFREVNTDDNDYEIAQMSYQGVRDVQQGRRSFFEIDYPCHSPSEYRWFFMRVLPLLGKPGQALVSHVNITDRKRFEEALQKSHKELEEKNIALKVLLEERFIEKEKNFNFMINNFKRLVFPYFEKIKTCNNKNDMLTILEIMEANIHECLTHEGNPRPSTYSALTPREIQVADLIKEGKTGKEIASILNISTRSVFHHRDNIRKKLNIKNSKTNLRSFLDSLS
jgi:DNA-binding CsgD family transcriptional regulator